MDKLKEYNALKAFCQEQGVDLFGVADMRQLKEDVMLSRDILARMDKAICLGAQLSGIILEEIKDAPTRLYFHHYRTLNMFLDQAALRVSAYIQKKGFLSMPIPASQIVDWHNQKAHLSHKKLGYLAGLGWMGRNNLLVNEKYGSQFRLVSILTNAPVKTDKPVSKDCQDCRLCVHVCPAGAIKENHLDFEHIRCFEKLKEFQKQRLVDQYICGICLRVCRGKRAVPQE